MKIASWNVNSINVRLPNLLAWLEEAKPDIVCLQELKCTDDNFPQMEIAALGYQIETHGQKTYNGVALLSRFPMSDVLRGLPDFDDPQSRYIEAVISLDGKSLRVASLYLPNGNPAENGKGKKYKYKLDWMTALQARARTLLSYEEICVLAGDYNVIPDVADVHDPTAWADDALFRYETRAAWRQLLYTGFTDALASQSKTGSDTYTFWDYQGGAWAKNKGIRIDHHLLSPLAADYLQNVQIDRHTREWEKPSDHVPIMIELNL